MVKRMCVCANVVIQNDGERGETWDQHQTFDSSLNKRCLSIILVFSVEMTILHFSSCLPTTSQRSLCVCISNWIESNFGADWIMLPTCTSHPLSLTSTSVYRETLEISISIHFYIHVCMLFLLISSVQLNWKSALSLYLSLLTSWTCVCAMCIQCALCRMDSYLYMLFGFLFFSSQSLVSAYSIFLMVVFTQKLNFLNFMQWLLLYCYIWYMNTLFCRDQMARDMVYGAQFFSWWNLCARINGMQCKCSAVQLKFEIIEDFFSNIKPICVCGMREIFRKISQNSLVHSLNSELSMRDARVNLQIHK